MVVLHAPVVPVQLAHADTLVQLVKSLTRRDLQRRLQHHQLRTPHAPHGETPARGSTVRRALPHRAGAQLPKHLSVQCRPKRDRQTLWRLCRPGHRRHPTVLHLNGHPRDVLLRAQEQRGRKEEVRELRHLVQRRRRASGHAGRDPQRRVYPQLQNILVMSQVWTETDLVPVQPTVEHLQGLTVDPQAAPPPEPLQPQRGTLNRPVWLHTDHRRERHLGAPGILLRVPGLLGPALSKREVNAPPCADVCRRAGQNQGEEHQRARLRVGPQDAAYPSTAFCIAASSLTPEPREGVRDWLMFILDHIADLVAQSRRDGERPLVVFDLDSTLIQTAHRHAHILREFAADFGHTWPALTEAVADLSASEFRWSVSGPLRRRGLNGPPELHDTLREYWGQRFFSGAYLAVDQAYPGAATYVHRLLSAGALIAYVTGRPAPTMAEQTLASLIRLGFPACIPQVSLSLKPRADMKDLDYKTNVCTHLAQVGTVVATFENEPGNANAFLDAFPDATHVLMDTVHSPGAPDLHSDVVRVKHF